MHPDSKESGIVDSGKNSKMGSGLSARDSATCKSLADVGSVALGGCVGAAVSGVGVRGGVGEETVVEVVILDPYPVVGSGLREWLSVDLPGALIRVAGSVGAMDLRVDLRVVEGRRRVWVVEIVDERGVPDWEQLDGLTDGGGVVVVFSRSSDAGIVHEAIRRGATSYVHKTEWRDALKNAVLKAASGHLFVSEAAAPGFLAQIRSANSVGPAFERSLQGLGLLTAREREVMKWLGQACSTRRIALKLGVSTKTVEAHAANIRGKLHLRSMRELLRAAALVRGEESPVAERGGVDGVSGAVC
jgi:DNA-binding NarL/FixJ family response regulator